jgi:signal transduction histidine kinase
LSLPAVGRAHYIRTVDQQSPPQRGPAANPADRPRVNFTLDLLANNSFPRIARILRERQGEIMRRWDDAVREVLPRADRLTLEGLRDSLPDIMEQMARALESDRPDLTLELAQMTRPHGETRFHQNFQIKEFIADFRIWRRVVTEEVFRGAGGGHRLSEDETIALNMAMDTAIEGGLVAYTDHQRQQIRQAADVESRYLSFLSHDLRNNLNNTTLTLEAHVQRLREVGGFDEDIVDLEAARQSIFHTISGMEQLLQAERLSKGAVEPRRQDVELRPLASSIVARLSRGATDKGLQLKVDVPEGARVRNDADLISLILQNLIGNAIKYSTRGTVRIKAAPQSQDAGWTLSVTDEGPGIAPEQASRLFDAFTRGETHGQAGMGLGLSIASQAAKLVGSGLEVESTVGAGCTFRFPVADVPA